MKERKEIGEFIRLNAVKLLGKKCNNGKKGEDYLLNIGKELKIKIT